MLGRSGCGCCLGMIIGLGFAIFLLAAAAFGIYCWLNPEARAKSINQVEATWTQVKTNVDNSIESVRRETNTPGPEVRPAPEPSKPQLETKELLPAEPDLF